MKTILTSLATICICLLISCSPTIATYDQFSYSQNASLKVEVLKLMEKSSEPYDNHKAGIEKVMTDVQKTMEYDIHKPKNAVMTKMWEILWKRIQSEEKKQGIGGQIAVGFFPFWKDKGSMSPAFADEAQAQIGQMFDTILDLEAGKIRESDVQTSVFEKFLK